MVDHCHSTYSPSPLGSTRTTMLPLYLTSKSLHTSALSLKKAFPFFLLSSSWLFYPLPAGNSSHSSCRYTAQGDGTGEGSSGTLGVEQGRGLVVHWGVEQGRGLVEAVAPLCTHVTNVHLRMYNVCTCNPPYRHYSRCQPGA